MEYKIITDFNAVTAQDWDQALARSQLSSPFLRYGFQKTWWKHLGGGEWDNGSLQIITAHEDGNLLGIAPLFITNVDGEKQAHFIGSFEICDYLDFIIPAQASNAFIKKVFEIISTDSEKIILYNIPDDSPTLAALEQISEQEGWLVETEKAYHTPAIALPDDWDTYLMGIDKKQRHEIRRKIRRAEGSEEDRVGWHIVGMDNDLDQAIADFTALMETDNDKEKFLRGEMRQQMDAIIRWAAEEGILQLAFLTINEKNAAGYLSFDYAGRIWVYNSGFSPGYGYYSPGWVLLAYLIQHAIESGKSHFDFMRGDEEYKYRFGAEDSFVMRSVISRKQT